MGRIHVWGVALPALLIAGLGGATQADTGATARSVTKDYIAGPVGDHQAVCVDDATGPSIGGACFAALASDAVVSFVVADDYAKDVRVGVVFENAAGNIIDRGGTCVPAGPFLIPAGTVTVRVNTVFLAALVDPECDRFERPVAGTITASFSGVRPPAAGRLQTKTYVAGTGTYVNCGDLSDPALPNIGGACFVPRPGETGVSVAVEGFGINRPFTLRFRRADGNVDLRFCNTSGLLTMPAGTTRVIVFASPFSGQPLYPCPGLFAYPVRGTIAATFS